MLAFVYLILMIMVGDALSRRFCNFVSPVHRWSTAFLVGLLLSSWTTYLAARLFASNARPLMFGNVVFFVAAGVTIYLLRRKNSGATKERKELPEEAKENKRDWIVVLALLVFVSWMMFSTFNMKAGNLQIANHEWSDFGPNIALMQSFAVGNNFPTEYPHFAGDRIRSHFLFYFQAGNLEYLGLSPALSNNLLSILSLVSMLMLVMTLGFLLFGSRVVGRISAALFFFHGSVAYVPFLRSQGSISNAINAATGLTAFLPSGFPYRGEDWGMWSLLNFLNQRHFASAIGVFLLTVCFLIERYLAASKAKVVELPTTQETDQSNITDATKRKNIFQWLEELVQGNASFLFIGSLVGLLPMWNGAVFIAALVVLVTFFVFFPLRRQMLLLLATTAIVALPQLVYLRTGDIRPAQYSLFHWGYTITDPTILNVLKYLAYTFGFKWVFIALAVIWMSWFQRRLALAFMSLVAVAFLFQFSEEVLANHKFLNIWLIVANVFVAYGIWRLWSVAVKRVPVRLATVGLVLLIVLGGVIDLFPIHRSYYAEVPFEGDPLLRWTRENTDPQAVFLSDRFVTHQILLAGRRIFFGWPYYSWGAGYKTAEREAIYRQMFEERDASRLTRLLKDNNISYVAIDNGLRNGDFITKLNEAVYENHFEKVFHDSDNRYGGLAIFKVAGNPGGSSETAVTTAADEPNLPAVNAFQGGRGMAHGQFASARGIAADSEGSIYVADTGNSRIQKFSTEGEFVTTIGRAGNGMGQLRDPVGVAVDTDGNIYVSDSGTHKLVKFGNDGKFVGQWAGPDPGFYGPLDVALGPQGYLYIVDQGHARIVVMDKLGNPLKEWGKKGSGDGEFDDPTGIAVGGDRVYVADLKNSRIQAFDLEGKFIRQWAIPSWRQQVFHNPDVFYDSRAHRVYVSDGATNEVLVFDPEGKSLGPRKSATSPKFDRPSGLALAEPNGLRRLYVMNTDGANLSWIDLGAADPSKEAVHSASAATVRSRND